MIESGDSHGNELLFVHIKKELKPLFGERLAIVDEPDFGYMIHIAKTSSGWKPCFSAHQHIRSVSDLENLYHKGCKIFDEYDTEYTWDEFVDRVVNFGNEQNWRTFHQCEQPLLATGEFISEDGYRFL